eukprot:2931916-Amphidinium_carterae.1
MVGGGRRDVMEVTVKIDDFVEMRKLGEGTFGKVLLVSHKETGHCSESQGRRSGEHNLIETMRNLQHSGSADQSLANSVTIQ